MQETVTTTRSTSITGVNGSGVLPLEDRPALQWISLAVRLALGVLFLVSAAEKLPILSDFGHAIANYKMLPLSMVNIAALLFVWTEMVLGVMLIAGAGVRGAGFVSGALLLLFIIAIITAMARGLEIDCGCFAPGQGEAEKVGWPKVFEDLAFLAGAVFLIYFPKSPFTLDRLLRRQGREGEQG